MHYRPRIGGASVSPLALCLARRPTVRCAAADSTGPPPVALYKVKVNRESRARALASASRVARDVRHAESPLGRDSCGHGGEPPHRAPVRALGAEARAVEASGRRRSPCSTQPSMKQCLQRKTVATRRRSERRPSARPSCFKECETLPNRHERQLELFAGDVADDVTPARAVAGPNPVGKDRKPHALSGDDQEP